LHNTEASEEDVASYRQMSEINITPFVDVMLVLLVIFMVAAPLMIAGVPVDFNRKRARRGSASRASRWWLR